MDIESIRMYCISKNAVIECMPFDDKTLVFKVAGKIFALAALDAYPLRLNLKCDPEKHWNTIEVNGEIPKEALYELIDHSYNLVIAK